MQIELRSGNITLEVALSIFSIILIIFVGMNSFFNNINKMVVSSNINSLIDENSAKTSYTHYNRSYNGSMIEVK